MSAAIRFRIGGGEAPWNTCSDGNIAVLVMALLRSNFKGNLWKGHVGRALEPIRVEVIP
jgi:hypothetical protein